MSLSDVLTFAALLAVVLIATPIVGAYMYRVFEGERTILSPVLRPVERAMYRIAGVDEAVEQGWQGYTVSVLMLALVSIVAVYVILRIQASLPLNANSAGSMSPDLSFNTAVSFATNTNWQNYSGEAATSDLAQAGGLVVQMFVSAAMGLAVAIALVRGLVRRSAATLGNFWVDLTRGVLYILLPIGIVAAVILIWQGVPQTLNAPSMITTLQGAHQTLSIGPIASQ
ncbi:MAG: potassium-transporting ATPase subunit KdpA, partial [Candidatus Limnocylindrales bacterium]